MRRDELWNLRAGGYIEPLYPGYNILVRGSNKYVNFGVTVGDSGYGLRDNSGTMQFKNNSGSWTDIGSGSTGSDEKVKFNDGDPTAGYVADKVVAGTGISVAEGTGGNENKLVITNTDKGSDVDLSGYALTGDIPADISELTDTTGIIPTSTSDLSNDSGFITAGDIPSIPVNSDFNLGGLGDVNDTGKATGKVLKYNSVSGDWEVGDATVEGVDVLSTGETGGVKYLRENGDGTCSWVEPSGGGQTLYDIVVAPTGGDYTTLSAAIAAATTGQTIFVKSGTYTESSTIDFYGIATDLRIIGENPNTTIIELDGATNGISLGKARPSFEDLQFTSDISNQHMVFGGDSGANIYFSFNNCIFNALSSSLYTWFNVVNGDRDQVRKITNCKFYGTPDNYTASLYFNTPNLQFTNNFIYSTSNSGGLIASFSNERNNVSNNQWIVKKLNGIEFFCEQGVFSDNSYYCNNDFYSRQILDLRGSDNLVTGNSLKTRQDNNTWLTYAYIIIGGTRNLFEGNSVGRGEGKTLTANTMVYVYGSNTVITGNFFGKIAGNKHVTISAADCYESKNVKLKTDGNLTPFYTNTDNTTATIDCDNYSEYYLTAVANDTAFSVTGTPHVGQTITVGFKDAGVSKNITWSSITELGITLPTATVAGKQHIVELKYIGGAWRAISAIVEA
jgi:hypothetical protein